ncbi:MAG: small multi-drug export protein [Kiritimatiellia bacterium]
MNTLIAILILFAVTCIPALELRASIPLGIFGMTEQLNLWVVVLICTIANIILGIAVYEILLPSLEIMRKWRWFEKKIWPHVEHRREKLRPSIEKYGTLGLALFIGVPLPGTGAVSGAIGAFLLGLGRRRFYWANALGVIIASLCVTALCLLIQQGVVADDSWISHLFMKK